jgi:hypothetical protein
VDNIKMLSLSDQQSSAKSSHGSGAAPCGGVTTKRKNKKPGEAVE